MREQPEYDFFLSGMSSRVRDVARVACEHGMGSAIQQIHHGALQHNLVFQEYDPKEPDQETLAITPRECGDRRLIRIRMRPDAGRIKMYLQTDEIVATYQVTSDEVENILGRKGWRHIGQEGIGEFLLQLDALFDLIESREGRQTTFADLFSESESSGSSVLIEGVVEAVVDLHRTPSVFVEGARTDVIQTKIERNQAARDECLLHYEPFCTCIVCHMNFKQAYGPIGEGFIHVHHRTPLSDYDGEHEVVPSRDLCPVCPNCHAMLHRKDPPYTIEELQTIREHYSSRQD